VNLFRKLDELPPSIHGGALTIGNFDGVHQGHVRIIHQLKLEAKAIRGPAIVFTFDPHPARLLRPDAAPPPLTWADRKADLLAELGVDAMIACPTDRALLNKTYLQFFQEIIVQGLGAQAMVEGPNFYFGYQRQGTPQHLSQLCHDHGIRLTIVEPLVVAGDLVSSSRIRDAVRLGDVDLAAALLTHPYRIRGMVTHGSSRGAELGFPTANLEAIDTLIPAFGIYAGRAHIGARPHWAAIHVGPNPTFGDQLPKVEVHILDYDQSLYGTVLEVDFVRRLRDIRHFESIESLVQQVQRDVQLVREIAQRTE
jgi:riboflavin kinase/FMN adenylyltransferase